MTRIITTLLLTLSICLGSSAQEIDFEQHVVSDSFTDGYDVWPFDLDQDSDMDILACGKGNGGQICYWLNDGEGNFSMSVLKQGFTGARSVRAGDMNGDNEIDIVSAAWQANDIIYFESTGNGSYTEILIDHDFKGAHTVDLKDINGDGAPDIMCSGFDYYGHNGEIAWWENGGQDSIIWVKHLISGRFQQSPFIFGEDMDNDGDLDALACGELNNEILWWENDGTGNFTAEHMVDDAFYSAHTVIARDVDQDGDMDILAAGCMNTKLAWYENDGQQNFDKHPLAPVGGDLWLDAADLDLDGDMDLVAAGMSASKLKWFENDGNQQFTKHDVDGGFSSGFAVIPANMDGDGDIDLLAIGNNSDLISWFENNADTTTSIGEEDVKPSPVLIYPNPCNNHLYIVDEVAALKKISIYSGAGKLERTLKTMDTFNSIWAGDLPDGLLIVEISYADKRHCSKKIIKQ